VFGRTARGACLLRRRADGRGPDGAAPKVTVGQLPLGEGRGEGQPILVGRVQHAVPV
jgi:hypothetical protein